MSDNTTELMEFIDGGQEIVAEAKALAVIKTKDRYEKAFDAVKRINGRVKIIKEYFKAKKDNAMRVLQDWRDAETEALEDWSAAKQTLTLAMKEFDEEQRRVAAEMQAKAEAEARARHEEEMERQREEALQVAEDLGMDPDEAVSFLNDEPEPEIPYVAPPKLKGTRVNWTWEVEDFSKVPDQYKTIDSSKLTALAKAEKGGASVPGVRFYSENIVAVR